MKCAAFLAAAGQAVDLEARDGESSIVVDKAW